MATRGGGCCVKFLLGKIQRKIFWEKHSAKKKVETCVKASIVQIEV